MKNILRTAQQKMFLLDAPLEALLLPDLEPVGRWGRIIHERLLEHAPRRFTELAATGTLQSFVQSEQERLSSVAQALGESWKHANPPPPTAGYFDLVGWYNNAKSYANECVMAQIAEDF